jgi:hypothetical protein
MLVKLRIEINKSPNDTFNFLCNKDKFKQPSTSPVLLIEKTTFGPLGVGTCYREVVQMMPFIKKDILSEVTRYEPFSVLEEKWRGGSMEGILTYFFNPIPGGTELIQHVNIKALGLLKPFDSMLSKTYTKAAQYRLECLKTFLETGRLPDLNKLKWWQSKR